MSRFAHMTIRCLTCGRKHLGKDNQGYSRAEKKRLESTNCYSCRTIITQLQGG